MGYKRINTCIHSININAILTSRIAHNKRVSVYQFTRAESKLAVLYIKDLAVINLFSISHSKADRALFHHELAVNKPNIVIAICNIVTFCIYDPAGIRTGSDNTIYTIIRRRSSGASCLCNNPI